MDLSATAGAFATIVGLISNFKSERSGGEMAEFIGWLREKRHEDIAAAISSNAELLGHLTALLSTNHSELVEKLNKLDRAISSYASHIDGLSGVAHSIHPEVNVSEQAISILRQLVASKAKLFMEQKVMTGEPDKYILMEGGNGKIKYDEPQFIEDDLKTLVELGLLRLEFGSRGNRRFFVTRAAVKLVSIANH